MTGPVLRVVSGNPSPEELAALTAVVSAAGARADAAGHATARTLERPGHARAAPAAPGPGAWQAALR